jgi:hypothetical protein
VGPRALVEGAVEGAVHDEFEDLDAAPGCLEGGAQVCDGREAKMLGLGGGAQGGEVGVLGGEEEALEGRGVRGDGEEAEDAAAAVVDDEGAEIRAELGGGEEAARVVQEGQVAQQDGGGAVWGGEGLASGGGEGAVDAVGASADEDAQGAALGGEGVEIADGHAAGDVERGAFGQSAPKLPRDGPLPQRLLEPRPAQRLLRRALGPPPPLQPHRARGPRNRGRGGRCPPHPVFLPPVFLPQRRHQGLTQRGGLGLQHQTGAVAGVVPHPVGVHQGHAASGVGGEPLGQGLRSRGLAQAQRAVGGEGLGEVGGLEEGVGAGDEVVP